jgi:hypothetical protein
MQDLDELWNRGQLRDLERDLDDFIASRRDEIARALHAAKRRAAALEPQGGAAISPDAALLDGCVRSLVRRVGSVNPQSDMAEQRREIENEIWYEGERRNAPVAEERREAIACDWVARYAAVWREWRILKILHVWSRKVGFYGRAFGLEAPPDGSAGAVGVEVLQGA